MKSLRASLFFFPLLAVILISSNLCTASVLTNACSMKDPPSGLKCSPVSVTSGKAKTSQLKTYIVHVSPPEKTVFTTSLEREDWYKSFLPVSLASSTAEPQIVHMYTHVMSGFAARLTEQELSEISKMKGFVDAYPSASYSRYTTHTPKFLGLDLNLKFGLWKQSNLGKGMIIGVLDGGLFPSHPSFDDAGMPPPPAKWKGRCDYNASLCNNKLIGARSFFAGAAKETNITDEVASPLIDNDGHGTHVASVAAGAFVPGAQVLASGTGTASGMAPYAHIAMYKVCAFGGPSDCVGADILAGMDAAVADGVDVLSLSLGGDPAIPFYKDELTVAAFGAIKKGVFPSCSAGNSGPNASSLVNEAPWLLTVAASTTDRRIKATVKLGNNMQFDGETLFQPKEFKPTFSPIIYAGAGRMPDAAFCGNGSLDGLNVKGKIVLCERGGGIGRITKGEFVRSAGGVAMILANGAQDGYSIIADAHALPASHVSFADASEIKKYISSTTNPTAVILFKGMVIEEGSRDPAVTSFSSRGPSIASPGILKPDITAPGVGILGAWPPSLGLPSSDDNNVIFNFMSGTSFSAPHISGIASLLKSVHPDWSPAAIKSALMTTADILDHSGNKVVNEQELPADLFAVGAGHVNPQKASYPGLVYDLSADDYVPYLCGLGYDNNQVNTIVGGPVDCSTVGKITEAELNYPSISVLFGSKMSPITVTRTAKNVGEAKSRYWVDVTAPIGVTVTVEPKVLQFAKVNQELKFKVTFSKRVTNATVSHSQGYLKWVSAKYFVRSPISVVF